MGSAILLSIGSATGYVTATFIMKYWDVIGSLKAILLIGLALAAAVLLETEALRQARFAYVAIIILGVESSLALVAGWVLLREAYARNGRPPANRRRCRHHTQRHACPMTG